MQGTLFDNVYFPEAENLFASQTIVDLADMAYVPDDVCKWIQREAKKSKEIDCRLYGTRVILKYCFFCIQNAFTLACLQENDCMAYDENGFAFNTGLIDKKKAMKF